MKNLFELTRTRAALGLAAVAGSLLLPGCGATAETPDVVGKRVGTAMCDHFTRVDELSYARDAQLAAEIKTGKIKTKAQARARYDELSTPLDKLTDINRQAPTTDSLIASLNAAFPNKEDRLAVGRVVTQYVDQCDAAQRARQEARPALHLTQLRMALPGPSAAVPYDPASSLPPPLPPMPGDTSN